jgi:hypothetical protein
MSSLVISGDTSGSVTLQAPAVSGSTVLTLPATSGTIITTASGTASSATTATTATNITGGVAGAIPYQSGSGATGFSAAGTSGQLLQSNGASAPTWVAPPGNYTLLTSGSIANGTTNFDVETGFTDATYTEIVIVFSNVKAASSQGYFTSYFKIGGSYYTSADYAFSKFASGETSQNTTAQSYMEMGWQQVRSSGTGTDAVFIVKNRFQRQSGSGVMTCLMPRTDSQNQIGMWWGFVNTTGNITGVRFFITSSSANFGSGTYAVYGFKYA